jgi:hypothetical protein
MAPGTVSRGPAAPAFGSLACPPGVTRPVAAGCGTTPGTPTARKRPDRTRRPVRRGLYPIGRYVELIGQEIAGARSQNLGNPNQVECRAIPDASLNTAHVAPADAGNEGERLLRQSSLLAKFAHPGPEPLQVRVLGRLSRAAWHRPNAERPCPFRPRPIGYNTLRHKRISKRYTL